jgi:hypothetical protein
MESRTNSRLITYPSVVEKCDSMTAVLIGATDSDIEKITIFCSTSNDNYDIYLYSSDAGDLEWLNHITFNAEWILIKPGSETTVSGSPNVVYVDEMVDFFKEIDKL